MKSGVNFFSEESSLQDELTTFKENFEPVKYKAKIFKTILIFQNAKVPTDERTDTVCYRISFTV